MFIIYGTAIDAENNCVQIEYLLQYNIPTDHYVLDKNVNFYAFAEIIFSFLRLDKWLSISPHLFKLG